MNEYPRRKIPYFFIIDFELYERVFNKVKKHLLNGNTYLTNFIFETRVQMNFDM